MKYAPEFRVGIAPAHYFYNLPLGRHHSIAYKMNGKLVTDTVSHDFGLTFEMGDVIGVAVSIPEVYLNQDITKICP